MIRLCVILITIILINVPITTIGTATVSLTEKQQEEISSILSYKTFSDKLSLFESSNRYYITSRSGTYLGKYQFGPSALHDVGITYGDEFLNSPALQEKALYLYLKENQRVLREEILLYSGEIINNVVVTESGILAAAHLVGARNVKRFLHSFGKIVPRDGNGTSMLVYLKEFSHFNFNLQFIDYEDTS